MRGWVATCVGLLFSVVAGCSIALAAPRLADEFDARDFTPAEIGIIQRSLTFAGYYDGLWDAQWGKISQGALERYTRDKYGAGPVPDAVLLPLFLDTIDMVHKLGWAEDYFKQFGVRLGVPTALVHHNAAATGRLEFVGEGVTIKVYVASPNTLTIRHQNLEGDRNPANHYIVRTANRWVTTSSIGSSLDYLRSDLVNGQWVSLDVHGPTSARDVMRYVTDSFVVGPDYEVNAETVANLTGLMAQAQAEYDAGGGQDDAPKAAAGDIISSGSGFFISNTTLVTNNHVVAGCGSLTDPGGQSFHVISTDPDLDLALLRFDGYSSDFLSLTPDAEVNLGEPVFALGYPYYGLINTELNFTSGVASAVNGFNNDPRNFTLTAPLQPGNSGGPIVDRHGNVVGVADAVADALKLASTTGSVPQNLNLAIKASTLAAFLTRLGAAYGIDRGSANIEDGVPPAMQRAVVPVLCHK